MNEFSKIINDFLQFIKHPEDSEHQNQSFSFQIKNILFLFLIEIPVMIGLLLVLQLVEYSGIIDMSNHSINNMLFDLPILVVFLTAIIIMPFIEEIIFRLYLRFKYNLPIQAILFFNNIIGKENNIERRLHTTWHSNYKYIFYFSALLFGFFHIINYESSLWVILLSPLLVMPQIVIGLFLGYIRVRFNVFSAFLFHAIHNFLFLGVTLIFLQSGELLIDKEMNDYQIMVKKVYFEKDGSYYSSKDLDTVEAKNMRLIYVISNINNIDEYKIQTNNDDKANQKINLNFYNIIHPDSSVFILRNQLRELFNYGLSSNKTLETVWNMEIIDSIKLNQYLSIDAKNSSNTIKQDSIILQNSNLNTVSKILQSEHKKNIEYNGTNLNKYTVKIENKDFEYIKALFKTEFGIDFIENEKEVEKYYLEFE